MSEVDPRTPVIVGAGQISNRGEDSEALDPASLAAEALRRAGTDSGAGDALLRRADSVRCLSSVSVHYRDMAAVVAEEVGAKPRQTMVTVVGGNGPQSLLNATSESIAAGELDVALIAGAEAFAALRASAMPARPPQGADVSPSDSFGAERIPCTPEETAVGLVAPVYVYALLENALRRRLGEDRATHMTKVADLWSRFSEVAAENPHAWLAEARSPAEIAEPSPNNRLVSAPYTKLMTANIGVDQGAGLIVCSAEAASAAGVPRERWVFPWSGAEATDEWFFSQRHEMGASPAIEAAGRAALEAAGVSIDEIGLVDLYSCFPVAVQVGAQALGLPLDDQARPLTLTGGLTFAGGPGNNYSTHGIATMVTRLREAPEATGLVSALGWYLTKHAIGIYSAAPPKWPFRRLEVQPDLPAPRQAVGDLTGEAEIEAYTVACDREGKPEAAIVSALAPDGRRGLLRDGNAAVLAELSAETDPLGRTITIADGRIEF